jgi:UDP-glucose 4-epimerase
MKCVIFGGGGFIGSAVTERLLADGHAIRVFERSGVVPYRPFAGNEQAEWRAGEFSSADDVSSAIDGVDAVVHLISTTLPKTSNDDPEYDVRSNVVSTLHLLDAMVKQRVKRLVFISSGGTVYGRPKQVPIAEDHSTDPLVSYGITKLTIEKYLALYQHLHGLETRTLRVSNPYGPRQRIDTGQGAIGVFIDKAIRGLPIEIWGDGNTARDYVHVDDVAAAFSRALTYQGPKSIFNIGSGVGVTLNDLVAGIGRVLGRPIEARYSGARVFDVQTNVLSPALAKQELGWEPSITLDDGLADVIAWQKKRLTTG